MARSRRTTVTVSVVALVVAVALAVAAFLALVLLPDRDSAADLDPAAAVNIRVHNGMDGAIGRLWLGRGTDPTAVEQPTFRTRYTDIGIDADSVYLTVEPHLPNYDGLNLVMGDRRFIVDTLALRPLVADLVPGGYYTFVLDQQGDQAVVTEVTTDPTPS